MLNRLPNAQTPTPVDKTIWKLTSNGIFSSKSTYYFILNNSKTETDSQQENQKNMTWIWKTPCHPR